jgi:hypothetical protein
MNNTDDSGLPRPDDARWITPLTAELDRRVEDLDAATLSRLNRARQAALASRAPRRSWWWIALPAAATAALVLGVGLAGRPAPTVPGTTVAAPVSAQDFELLSSDDTLELYQEDLDFYAWLDADDGAPAG